LFGLLFCYPLSFVLPPRYGWENGWVEAGQVLILLVGLVAALRYATRALDSAGQCFWLMIAPFWLICMGREISWGEVFLKPVHVDEEGPGFSSSLLWYKPAVCFFVGGPGSHSVRSGFASTLRL